LQSFSTVPDGVFERLKKTMQVRVPGYDPAFSPSWAQKNLTNCEASSKVRYGGNKMAERMGKAHLVQEIASKAGVTRKQAGSAVDATIAAVLAGVKKGSVTLPGLGTFSVVKTKARTGVRPGTKNKIKIPAGKRLRFKASSTLKGKI
jgi:DNA-binding protein HU-beta